MEVDFGKTAEDDSRHRAAAFDRAHAAPLDAGFPEDPLVVPQRCFALIAVSG
ncbi:MAG: hypothetical protein QNJ30_14240 [Kiloniellales bacterium]|nr:hypothetical protein [Kiloniellales bacterium]